MGLPLVGNITQMVKQFHHISKTTYMSDPILSDEDVSKATALAWHKIVTTIYDNPFIPSSELLPSHKQVEFLSYEGPECLFGGACAGGKTSALLMAALQYVTVPGYHAVLIRRTYRQLNASDGLIPRSKEWIGNKAQFREKSMEWTFPSGSTLTFGYYDSDPDYMNFQGGAWSFVGFDEATQLKDPWYLYLFSRLRQADWVCRHCKLPLMREFGGPFQHRKEGRCTNPDPIPQATDKNGIALPDVPLRVRAAANPGGPSHEFFRRRFVVPDAPKKFIKSFLKDNPGIGKDDYIRNLGELDPITRAQLLNGDWDTYEGGRFRKFWFREFWVQPDRYGDPVYKWNNQDVNGQLHNGWPTCPYEGIPVSKCWNFITCDPAASNDDKNDYTVIGAFAVTPNGELLVLWIVREQIPVEHIVQRIESVCRDFDPQFVGIEDVAFQLGIVREGQRSLGVAVERLNPEGKGKLVRATPAIIRASEGQIFIPLQKFTRDQPKGTFPWLEDFLAELIQFTGDDKKDSHDDCVDCLAYAAISLGKHGLAAPIVIQPDDSYEDMERPAIFMTNPKDHRWN